MVPYIVMLSLFLSLSVIAQEDSKSVAAPLTYKPEVPDSSTYKVILNKNYKTIEPDILKQINFHRKQDEIFIWYVEEGLVIEILPLNMIKR